MCCFLHFFNISKTVTLVEKDFVPMHFVPKGFCYHNIFIPMHFQRDFAPKKYTSKFPQRPGENWMDVFLVFLGVLTTWILGPFGIEVVPWSKQGTRRDALRMFHRWGNPWANPHLNVRMSIWKISAALLLKLIVNIATSYACIYNIYIISAMFTHFGYVKLPCKQLQSL